MAVSDNLLPQKEYFFSIFYAPLILEYIYNVHVRLQLLVIFLFISTGLCAQISIWEDEAIVDPAKAEVKYQVLDQGSISDSTLNRLLTKEWTPLSGPFALKNMPQTVWVKIPCNQLSVDTKWLLINDRHINEIKVWIVKNGEIVKSFPITGDHFNFESRPFPTIDFVFPLPTKELDSCELLIACDKRHVKTILPIHLLSDGSYFQQAESKNIFQGILLGLVAIMLLYNFSLFFATRLSLYIWYGIYLSTVFVYFFAEMGYFFQYITPHLPSWNDVFPVGVIASSFIPFIIFINQMLELKKNQPWFFKINNGFLIGFTFILITGILFSFYGDFVIQEYWLRIYSIISPTFLLILLLESLVCLKKKIPFATYTSLSILSLILMSAVYLLLDAGLLPMNIITSNALVVGITIEICIMTIAIAARFDSYKKASELLAIKQEREKDQIIKTISDFKEQEMLRFSNMLHDSVGARLSAIRLNIEAMNKLDEDDNKSARISAITEDIGNLADEVRIFSHQLSPVLLEEKGLIETISNLIKAINRSGVLHIQFEPIGSGRKILFHYELLLYNIVQELIQNIIRHAQATEVIVQLILEEDLISVYAEDNGKGFDTTKVFEGLGLTQIKKLTGFVNGSFNMQSSKSGTIISIEFNLKHNETID